MRRSIRLATLLRLSNFQEGHREKRKRGILSFRTWNPLMSKPRTQSRSIWNHVDSDFGGFVPPYMGTDFELEAEGLNDLPYDASRDAYGDMILYRL